MAGPDDKKPPGRPPTSPFGYPRVAGPAIPATDVHRDLHADIEFRLHQFEKNDEAIESRLQAGASTLASLKDAVNQISERVKPIPSWMLVSIVLAIVGAIGGAVATFYSRTDEARRESATSQRTVEEKMHEVQIEQANVKSNLEQIKKSVDRTERVLDDLVRLKSKK
jgi:hypothetical protein